MAKINLGRCLVHAIVLAAATAASGQHLGAQSDTVTVVASEQYRAGSFQEYLFGTTYRDLWAMPIRVPVLDLRSYAGGLTPTQVGGGQQTSSLRFLGADGHEYQFRSVNKRPLRTQQADLAGALAGKLLQDQVSSLVPGAPVPASRIALAVGLLHARPDLFVMPDDPALGEFRDQFAGMLGTLEERADELEEGGPGFAGFRRIVSTETMFDDLEEDPTSHVDSRAYLAARLTDLILGDWDRHADQWRWARRDTDQGALWLPIPRDRDYAFANYDGAAMKTVRRFSPNTTRFFEVYADLAGLILNGQEIDRRILNDLDRATWDSVAVEVQRNLTDAEVDAAIRTMPREYYAVWGEPIAAMVKLRRDRLQEAVAEFYERASNYVEIRTTDEDEVAWLTRMPDGTVDVRVDSDGAQYYRRVFRPDETDEVRLFLRGGDDHAMVRGSSPSAIRLRVIGGGGKDLLADSSSVGKPGNWTIFHDEGDGTQFVTGPTTSVNRWPEREEEEELSAIIPGPRRDFGKNLSFAPIADYSTTRGVVLGAGIGMTRLAFRRHPWASHTFANLRFSTRWRDVGLEAGGVFNSPNPAWQLNGHLLASRIDAVRFYGFGNETERTLPSELYVVRREIVEATADARYSLRPNLDAYAGPIARYARPTVLDGSPVDVLQPLGHDGFSTWGIRSGVKLEPGDGVDRPAVGVELETDYFLVASDHAEPAIDLHGLGTVRIPLAAGGSTALSARAGGKYLWGDYPFYSAAFLGGKHSVRGYPEARFAGDGMVFGSAEFSAFVTRLPVLVNWKVTPFVFADAGRVFYAGEDSNEWHVAPGAGLELSALGLIGRFTYADGPDPRVYAEFGRPF